MSGWLSSSPWLRRLVLIGCLFTDVAAGQGAAKKVIVIDPGHGGKDDSGTVAAENKSDANHAALVGNAAIKESLLTLELSRRVAALINETAKTEGHAVECVLTRTQDDQNPNFTERMETAAKAHADLIVAIHFNSGETASSNGPVCIYPRAAVNSHVERDKALALAVSDAVRKTTQAFEKPGFTTHSVCFDDSDMLTQRMNGKQIRPNGSYLFLQARNNPALRQTPVIYLEVDFLESKRYQDRARTLFVEKKPEVFEAWARAIAKVLREQVEALKS